MPDLIRKVITCDVKEISDRVLEFVGSTEGQDRDGEVISVDGWDTKNYKKNPVFLWAHRYDQPPIGKSRKVWTDEGKLKFEVEFADKDTYEFADTIYRLFKGGFLKATSVGFVPKEWEDGDGDKAPRRTYKKQELLELSAVPVPSNPEALVQAREAGLITVKELEAITKPEVTEEYIRIPVPGESGKHEGHRIRTITISEDKGIKALYCGECKKNITYLFDKDKWTMEEAKRWVEEHKWLDDLYAIKEEEMVICPSVFSSTIGDQPISILTTNSTELETYVPIRALTQAQIKDEFDYAKSIIERGDLSLENIDIVWDMTREIMRITGSDIPDDIQEKVGAVLNQKNKDRLSQIKTLAQAVLDSAGEAEEPEKDVNNSDETIASAVAEILADKLGVRK